MPILRAVDISTTQGAMPEQRRCLAATPGPGPQAHYWHAAKTHPPSPTASVQTSFSAAAFTAWTDTTACAPWSHQRLPRTTAAGAAGSDSLRRDANKTPRRPRHPLWPSPSSMEPSQPACSTATGRRQRAALVRSGKAARAIREKDYLPGAADDPLRACCGVPDDNPGHGGGEPKSSLRCSRGHRRGRGSCSGRRSTTDQARHGTWHGCAPELRGTKRCSGAVALNGAVGCTATLGDWACSAARHRQHPRASRCERLPGPGPAGALAGPARSYGIRAERRQLGGGGTRSENDQLGRPALAAHRIVRRARLAFEGAVPDAPSERWPPPLFVTRSPQSAVTHHASWGAGPLQPDFDVAVLRSKICTTSLTQAGGDTVNCARSEAVSK